MTQTGRVIKKAYDDQGKLVETLRYNVPINSYTRYIIERFEYRHFIEAFGRSIKSTYEINKENE